MSALTTFTAGVSRVNLFQRYAGKHGFVLQERAELCKRPRMQDGLSITPSPYPAKNASQCFDGNSASGAFGFIDNFLRNCMVEVLGKARFFTREFLEVPLGASRTVGLKFSSKFAVAVPHIIHGAAAVGVAVRIGSNEHDPHIDAKEVIYDAGWWIWNITCRGEVELVTVIDEVRFSLLRLQQVLLTFAGRVWDVLPPLRRPNADRRLFVAENATVVADGTVLCKTTLPLPIQFVGICNLSQDPHDNLSAERKFLPSLMVDKFLQGVLCELLLFPGDSTNPITAIVCGLKRMEQRLALFSRNVQTNFSSQLQYLNCTPEKGIA